MVSRRNFLRGSFRSTAPPLRPPWALAEQLFIRACTRCGACAPVCPTRIISIQSGFPQIDFKRGECSFCGACAQACRDGALQDSELQLWPWAIKAQVGRECIARRGSECRICGDQCGPGAIRFSPRIGGPPEPVVDSNVCTGCGACVAPCPVSTITVV